MRYVFLKKIYCPKTDLRNCCLDKMIQVILKKFKDMEKELLENAKKIERFRSEYLPEKIQLLLVGEAPPDSGDRFFYYSDVRKADYLFLAILKAFCGEEISEKYVAYRKRTNVSEIKIQLLNKLKENGIYLMDLSPFPAGKITPGSQKDTFMNYLEKLIKNRNMDKDTPIILIKKSVYECLYMELINKNYCVLNQGVIPFPSCGQQTNFNEKFLDTLKKNKISTILK